MSDFLSEALTVSAEELISTVYDGELALALEGLGLSGPELDAKVPPKRPPRPTTFILYRDGVYNLTLNMLNADDSFFAGCMPLVLWLNNVPADTKINLYLTERVGNDSGDLLFMPRFLTILNQLYTCQADITFVADRGFGDVSPYVAMACRRIKVSAMAAFSIQPSMILTGRGDFGAAMGYFLARLRQAGVEKGLLTQEEADGLAAGRAVYLPPTQVLERATTVGLCRFAPSA